MIILITNIVNIVTEFGSVFKGSSDPSHFNFEINVGKRRIRYRTNPNLNERIFQRRFKMTSFKIQSRSMSDPSFFDIVLTNKAPDEKRNHDYYLCE